MREWWLRFLRVPTEPRVPAGSANPTIFRAAPNYFRYKATLWFFGQLGALVGLFVGLLFLGRLDFDSRWLRLAFYRFELISWTAYLIQLPFSYLLLRLDFEMRWYVLADRSLRIREGILHIREKTMTFANVQQISIRENPLQRLLGIADVQVRSAGGGGGSTSSGTEMKESAHEAWFRGVARADLIAREIRERVNRFRDSGLGDPDDHGTPRDNSLAPAVEAARSLHAEVRELRRTLVAPRISGSP